MTSLQTFISMLDTFLKELSETFPTNKSLGAYVIKFDLLKKSNPRGVLNLFVEHTTPYATLINSKDETLFTQDMVPFLKEMNFKASWENESTTDGTKSAIWAHLTSLQFFATTISSIPEGLMNNIELLAQQYAGQLQESPMSMDPASLMENMQNMMNVQMKQPDAQLN